MTEVTTIPIGTEARMEVHASDGELLLRVMPGTAIGNYIEGKLTHNQLEALRTALNEAELKPKAKRKARKRKARISAF
jgi:hypothetical protein